METITLPRPSRVTISVYTTFEVAQTTASLTIVPFTVSTIAPTSGPEASDPGDSTITQTVTRTKTITLQDVGTESTGVVLVSALPALGPGSANGGNNNGPNDDSNGDDNDDDDGDDSDDDDDDDKGDEGDDEEDDAAKALV